MHKIDQSVRLDLDRKEIVCNLPVKGDEREYLTTNYGQARMILNQQVKQYYNMAETKDLIIKAFDKLFQNGHAAFIEELTEEEKVLFIRKEIQYFIPWRVAFSESVTTPA